MSGHEAGQRHTAEGRNQVEPDDPLIASQCARADLAGSAVFQPDFEELANGEPFTG